MLILKDTKTVAYLILKGKEVLKMGKDDLGDSTFSFENDDNIDGLVSEFPLTAFKRYIDIYKEIIKAIKGN
jgi:hypothetical protein